MKEKDNQDLENAHCFYFCFNNSFRNIYVLFIISGKYLLPGNNTLTVMVNWNA